MVSAVITDAAQYRSVIAELGFSYVPNSINSLD